MLVFDVLGNNSIKSQYIYRLIIPVLSNSLFLCLLCTRVLAQVFFALLITCKWNALKECYFTYGGLCVGTLEVYLYAELLIPNGRISHQECLIRAPGWLSH